jgi:hypothetical protein
VAAGFQASFWVSRTQPRWKRSNVDKQVSSVIGRPEVMPPGWQIALDKRACVDREPINSRMINSEAPQTGF